MVKDHSDSEIGNPLPPHGRLFPINSKGSFICTIAHTGQHMSRPCMDGWVDASHRHTDNYQKYYVKMFSYAVNVM